MRRRPSSPVELLDPDPGDARLERVGETPVAWESRGLLTIAVRHAGEAPFLLGTVSERMRPAGVSCWALRLRVPQLERACIEYRIPGSSDSEPETLHVWRGPRAEVREPPPQAALRSLPSQAIGGSEIAARHPVKVWSPADPRAVLVCADGSGLEGWASIVEASGEPVALVGIDDAGRHWTPEEFEAGTYDARTDPRARAYLPDVDPPYFAAHMEYAIETVLPWADEQFGRLPKLCFGVSNGAAWSAAAAALHPGQFVAVLAFSLAHRPARPKVGPLPAHALVAGRLEPGFHRQTTRYARQLERRRVPVRLRTPVRGHDYSMWAEELLPALRWALTVNS